MNAGRMRRAALYVRVSTDRQTVENQVAKLTQVAKARGWQIVATFTDAGISGAKGRKDRPGLDDMLKQAQRGTFDIVMAWAIDRVGRSLIDLLGTIQHLAHLIPLASRIATFVGSSQDSRPGERTRLV